MKFIKYIFTSLLLIIGCVNINAATAEQIMSLAAAKARNAKGVSAVFTINSSGRLINGTLKSRGNKFSLTTSTSSSWFNGKNMWTYNPSINETTVITPTKEEIMESNPLEYLKTYSSSFKSAFSKKKMTGKYVLLLTPKSKSNQVKSIEIIIDAKTYKPSKFTITSGAGTVNVINIKSLDYSSILAHSEFEYPRKKYPKAQIIDLR